MAERGRCLTFTFCILGDRLNERSIRLRINRGNILSGCRCIFLDQFSVKIEVQCSGLIVAFSDLAVLLTVIVRIKTDLVEFLKDTVRDLIVDLI